MTKYEDQTDRTVDYGKKGIVKASEILAAGISKEFFYQYTEKAGLEKTAHGIYISTDAWPDETLCD